eukprot:CAMPEP_0197722692 /NCGR_PEP_ID=MMETSP1434-20131217/5296_1 /TAXON_ID=265543 /ORGANISM="Minutocellus polymorphus, Strain CCMP3303" /LENGTH=71 /DNA_ID=CAMNT_0043307879 /DNA_START=189 /DNA_END=400 /DNA_ORIENTATION=+
MALPILPLLAFRRLALLLVVLLLDLVPVGAQHRPSTGLVALDHRPTRFIICLSIYLLEELVEGLLTLGFLG